MNKQDITLLYKYNQWADAKILNSAVHVTSEQFLASATFPHGGLRGTLVHTLFAEWIWRHRWEGTSPVVRLKSNDFPTFESLRSRWADEEKLLMSFVDNVTDMVNTIKDLGPSPLKSASPLEGGASPMGHGTKYQPTESEGQK